MYRNHFQDLLNHIHLRDPVFQSSVYQPQHRMIRFGCLAELKENHKWFLLKYWKSKMNSLWLASLKNTWDREDLCRLAGKDMLIWINMASFMMCFTIEWICSIPKIRFILKLLNEDRGIWKAVSLNQLMIMEATTTH